MKKFFFMAATAALALSSCSSDELVQTPEVNAQDGAVAFSVYTGRQTRAMDNAQLALAKDGGFGVFAYDQGELSFENYMKGNTTPNFMYNQQVRAYNNTTVVADGDLSSLTTSGFDRWGYDPVKYWSNNLGAKHSFFAYAPYDPALSSAVGANPRLVLNSQYGGPALEYSFIQTGGADILCAPAYIDRTKPAVDKNDVATTGTSDNVNGKMQFQFKHALSKVSFNIQTWVDEKTDGPTGKEHEVTPTATTKVDAKTKVIVKSLKLNGKFASKGFLKLLDGTWVTSSAAHTDIELLDEPITLEGEGAEEPFDQLTDILFFPLEGSEKFKITITYDVATDANGDGDYDDLNDSKITNVITSVGDGFALEQNTAYEYHLNLGLETVKFDATVTDWVDGKKIEVDLPANLYHGLTAVNVLNYYTTAPFPEKEGDVYLNVTGTPVKAMKYESSAWTEDTSVNGVVKTAADTYYELASGQASTPLTYSPIYYNPADGKFYSTYTADPENYSGPIDVLTHDAYYVINGGLYKAN